MLRIATAVVLIVLGIGLAVPVANRLADGPLAFVVPAGEQWAGPWHRRLRFWWGPTFRRSVQMQMRVRLDEIPAGTSCKLWGFSQLTTRMQRVRRYGWDEWADIAHEDSDRFVGTVVARKGQKMLRISTYAYRRALGGITPSDQRSADHPASVVLGYVPGDSSFTMALSIEEDGTRYRLWQGGDSTSHHVPRDHQPARLAMKNFFHCDGGPRQPGAPADIHFTASKP